MLFAAGQLSITLLAYSTQRQGILTGRYRDKRISIRDVHRLRRRIMGFHPAALDHSQPLIDRMRSVAENHRASVGQITLAWLVGFYDGTAIPIAGASRPHQADQAAICRQCGPPQPAP